jgi:hypothetical protein
MWAACKEKNTSYGIILVVWIQDVVDTFFAIITKFDLKKVWCVRGQDF